MPPPSLLSAVPCPVRRVRLYFICASSTCNAPSRLTARCANMSSISAVRSITLTPSRVSRFLSWLPVSSSSNITSSASVSLHNRLSSSTLPLPIYVALSGVRRFCMLRATTFAPAVFASSASSSIVSYPSSFSRPTSTVLSGISSLVSLVLLFSLSSDTYISSISCLCGSLYGLSGPYMSASRSSPTASPM